MGFPIMPPPSPGFSGKTAIVGVGETDYGDDYKAARAKAEGYTPPTPESLTKLAFERALADSGLERKDIDGLTVSYLYGGPDVADVARDLGISPRFQQESFGLMAGTLPEVCGAIAEGKCDTVAMIYAVATRSIGRKFGGQNFGDDSGAPASYYYHNPWGFSSQAAHWALIWRNYMETYGKTEADLAEVAVQLRKNAQQHPQAIMQKPLTVEDYLASRYIVKPLHLVDMCLVNDGGVCLIIRRSDMAKDTAKPPVGIAGWGESVVKRDKLQTLVRDRLRPQFQESGQQALTMAGMDIGDIQHFECYDAATIHLINHLEGHGLVEQGTGLDFVKDGGIGVGGKLPTNTAGGMLSGSYMHGWNHVAEITRQLRHEAGPRQVPGVEISMFSLAQTDRVHPLIFTRGAKS